MKFKYPRKFLKNEICSMRIRPETWILFLALNNIFFLWAFGKSLRNNAPRTIPSSTLPWYLLKYHQRYSRYQKQSTPSTLPKQPCYPCCYTTHVTHTGLSPTLARHPRNPRWHTTHTSMPPILVRLPRKHTKHATHASTPPMPPTLARHPRYPR